MLSAVAGRFWAETEPAFYALVEQNAEAIIAAGDVSSTKLRRSRRLSRRAGSRRCTARLAVFDQSAPIEDSDPDCLAEVINGRKFLSMMFKGQGPGGKQFYAALTLAPPERSDRKDRNGKPKRGAK